MTDHQFDELINKLDLLTNRISQPNSSPVSPVSPTPSSTHSNGDIETLKKRLFRLKNDWTDEFTQLLQDEINLELNSLKEKKKMLKQRLRATSVLLHDERAYLQVELDKITQQIKETAKKPTKKFRKVQSERITEQIRDAEFEEDASNAGLFDGTNGLVSRYYHEKSKQREMQSIFSGGTGRIQDEFTGKNVMSRYQTDINLREKLEKFKQLVLDRLSSSLADVEGQLQDVSGKTQDEIDGLLTQKKDLTKRIQKTFTSHPLQVAQDSIFENDALSQQSEIIEQSRERAKAEYIANSRYRQIRGQDFYGNEIEDDNSTVEKATANVSKRNYRIEEIKGQLSELSERWDAEFEDYLEKEQWEREAQLQRIKESLQARLANDPKISPDDSSFEAIEERDKVIEQLRKIETELEHVATLTARESKKETLVKDRDRQIEAKEKSEKKLGEQAFSDFFSGGKSGKLGKQGESWTKAGDAMSKVGGKIGKFGGFVSKAGGMLSKFAGPVGMAIQALQLLADGAKAVAEAEAKMAEIQNERNTARTQRNIERSKLDTQSLIDQMETATASGLASLQTEGSIAMGQQQIDNRERMAQIQTQTDSITNGFNSTAWEALNRSIDIDAAKQKLETMASTERGKTERANVLRAQELSGREAVRQVDAKLIDQELRATETRLNQEERDLRREHPYGVMGAEAMLGADTSANNVFNPAGTSYGEVEAAYNPNMAVATASGVVESIPLIGGIATSAADAAYMHQDTMAKQKLVNEKNELDSIKALTENTTSLSNTMLSSSNQITDAAADLYKGINDLMVDAQAEQLHTMAQFSQKVEQWALKFDKTMRNSAAGKGFTTREQNAQYGVYMNQVTQHLAHQWGLKNEEIFQMQDSYGANTGRSLVGSMSDLDKTAAVGKYLGDNKLAVELASSTEIFNMGMSTTMDMVWDMTKKVNKMGLDGRKYMKDIAQNLKMAQKYDFRGGVQGLMEMTKWAQNVRFNMSNIPALLDNIMGGGLEGIITKAAKLQVLGGRFAMGADPLAMTWETYNDPEALAKRVNDMTKGMGYWDSKTGQVKFNQVDTERLRALAEYTNQSLEDVKNQASYSVKESQVGQYINSDLNSEQYSSLVNKAYYDAEKGWMVNTITGNPMEIGQINSDNIRMVQAETHDGVVEQALQEIVGHLDKETGLSEEEMAKFADAITNLGILEENQQKRYEEQVKFFTEKFDENLSKIKTNIEAATTAFTTQLHQDTMDPQAAAAKATKEVNQTLGEVKGIVNTIATKMQASIDAANSSVGSSIDSELVDKMEAAWTRFDDENSGSKSTRRTQLNNLKAKYTNSDGSVNWNSLKKDTDFKKYLSEGAGRDLEYYVKQKSGIGYNDVWTDKQVQALYEAMDDGVTSGNGSPMSVAASKVTPINDGEIAQTDPNDHAIFAKVGGPFDTLFNKTFVRIDDVYNMLHDSLNPSIEPKEYIPYKDVVIRELSAASGYINASNNGGEFSFEPLKIEMSGSLQLDGGNGQSVDLMNVLKENPMILRSLTEMISNAISSQMNGGRGVYNGGRMVSFK